MVGESNANWNSRGNCNYSIEIGGFYRFRLIAGSVRINWGVSIGRGRSALAVLGKFRLLA